MHDDAFAFALRHLTGETVPSEEGFASVARGRRVVPVVRKLLADGETPVGLYRKLAADRPGTFLLESAEHGRVWSRYSFIGARCAAMLTEVGGEARWLGSPPPGAVTGGRVDDALSGTLAALHTPRIGGLPPLTSGLVGAIAYDAVRRWERVPDIAPDELRLPEVALLVASDLAVLDHSDGSVLLVANSFMRDGDEDEEYLSRRYRDSSSRLDAMERDLRQSSVSTIATYDTEVTPVVESRTSREEYLANVERVKERIRAGDAFQVVLSQRFEVDTRADALDIYRVLRVTNPSPYMYLFRFPDAPAQVGQSSDEGELGSRVGFEVVGSSPEALVKLDEGRAMLHPIAGTRPRGASAAEDGALAEELLADDKERSEHLMLVDLGRNDLGRVCEPGSVEVVDFMEVERYSHVMHIVSTVVGRLCASRTAYDLLAATFPAGTLSGAPKPMAMSIIEELEPARRGLYGGIVGYLDFAGDMDTAICIRTAILRDGRAYVQAGAGLVADSNPEAEDDECRSKAAAVLRAIAAAGTLNEEGASANDVL